MVAGLAGWPANLQAGRQTDRQTGWLVVYGSTVFHGMLVWRNISLKTYCSGWGNEGQWRLIGLECWKGQSKTCLHVLDVTTKSVLIGRGWPEWPMVIYILINYF